MGPSGGTKYLGGVLLPDGRGAYVDEPRDVHPHWWHGAEIMLGLDSAWALGITTLILLIYVVLGGAHADILTDGVQGFMMLLVAVLVIVTATEVAFRLAFASFVAFRAFPAFSAGGKGALRL